MRVGILPCQGSCNVGAMTNKISVNMVEQELAHMVCPLGLPLGIEGIINSAKKNEKYIALNGCPIKCASKALESVDINDFTEITLTSDFGIKKNGNMREENGMHEVQNAVVEQIKKFQV